MEIQMSDEQNETLKLDEDTLMVLGALRSNKAEDVLMLLPEDNVKKILGNRKAVVEMLSEHRKLEVTTQIDLDIIKAKGNMTVNMYKNI